MKRDPYSSTDLLRGAYIGPRRCGSYPLDLNGSLDFTRATFAVHPQPHRPMLGYVQGVLPFVDGLVRQGMYAVPQRGPFTTQVEVNRAGSIFERTNTRTVTPEIRKVQK